MGSKENELNPHKCFVMYRYPKQSAIHILAPQKIQYLTSIEELSKIEKGFVFAPFNTENEPIIIFTDCKHNEYEPSKYGNAISISERNDQISDSYTTDFKAFKQAIQNKKFSKIVLARTLEVEVNSAPINFFTDACETYPNSYIYLFVNDKDIWFGATPEILIEGDAEKMHTISLAGTMLRSNDLPDISAWDNKNIKEQKIVTDYILSQIQPFSTDITTIGPYSVPAAHLIHLRTDISFKITKDALPQVIAALHPTPAVCGLPKNESIDFITKNEHIKREYYAGFLGWYNPTEQTQLFVNLRCMKWIDTKKVRLFSGGGILAESELESEWTETENKMRTLLNLSSFQAKS